MNKIILKGNIVKDIDVRETNGMKIARLTVAVSRRDKEKTSDFIECVGFGKMAEFLEKYFAKGQAILIQGRLQISNYTDKNGNNKTSANVVIEETDFCGSKNGVKSASKPLEEVADEDLPF